MGKVVLNWENGKLGLDGSVLESLKALILRIVSLYFFLCFEVKRNFIYNCWGLKLGSYFCCLFIYLLFYESIYY